MGTLKKLKGGSEAPVGILSYQGPEQTDGRAIQVLAGPIQERGYLDAVMQAAGQPGEGRINSKRYTRGDDVDIWEYSGGVPLPTVFGATFSSDSAAVRTIESRAPMHMWYKVLKKDGREAAVLIIACPESNKEFIKVKIDGDAILESFKLS